jgi:hypothetical protein
MTTSRTVPYNSSGDTWPIPEDDEPVSGGAYQIRTLANNVANALRGLKATQVTLNNGKSVQAELDNVLSISNNIGLAPRTVHIHYHLEPGNYGAGFASRVRIDGIPLGYAPDTWVSPNGEAVGNKFVDLWIYRRWYNPSGTVNAAGIDKSGTAGMDFLVQILSPINVTYRAPHHIMVLCMPPALRVGTFGMQQKLQLRGIGTSTGPAPSLADMLRGTPTSSPLDIDPGFDPVTRYYESRPDTSPGAAPGATINVERLATNADSLPVHTAQYATQSLRSGSGGKFDGGHVEFTLSPSDFQPLTHA